MPPPHHDVHRGDWLLGLGEDVECHVAAQLRDVREEHPRAVVALDEALRHGVAFAREDVLEGRGTPEEAHPEVAHSPENVGRHVGPRTDSPDSDWAVRHHVLQVLDEGAHGSCPQALVEGGHGHVQKVGLVLVCVSRLGASGELKQIPRGSPNGPTQIPWGNPQGPSPNFSTQNAPGAPQPKATLNNQGTEPDIQEEARGIPGRIFWSVGIPGRIFWGVGIPGRIFWNSWRGKYR